MARFVKGQSGNPAGRPRGAKSKINGDMRLEFWRVYYALKEAGLGLEEEAKKNPTWFYGVFATRMIPRNIDLGGDGGDGLLEGLSSIVRAINARKKAEEEPQKQKLLEDTSQKGVG
jgi:Family of unknown function (DUF5681)